MQRLKFFLASLAVLLLTLPAVTNATVSAAWSPFSAACSKAKSVTSKSTACTTTGNNPLTGKDGILYKTSRIIAIIAAIGAVIMIIVGGWMYITAAGDTSKAQNARKMIIAAVGGLVVIALAEAIVAFAVNVVR